MAAVPARGTGGAPQALAAQYRLDRLQSLEALQCRIEPIAKDLSREFEDFQQTRYARELRDWVPLSVAGLLFVVGTVASTPLAFALAGATFALDVIDRRLNASTVRPPKEHAFHLLSGLRRDVLRHTKIRSLA